jgi:hypothetical protein
MQDKPLGKKLWCWSVSFKGTKIEGKADSLVEAAQGVEGAIDQVLGVKKVRVTLLDKFLRKRKRKKS